MFKFYALENIHSSNIWWMKYAEQQVSLTLCHVHPVVIQICYHYRVIHMLITWGESCLCLPWIIKQTSKHIQRLAIFNDDLGGPLRNSLWNNSEISLSSRDISRGKTMNFFWKGKLRSLRLFRNASSAMKFSFLMEHWFLWT